MKLLHAEYINGQFAELFLADDQIVIAKYANQTISVSGGGTYQNIQDIYSLYLQFCVKIYLSQQRDREEKDALRSLAGSLGWTDIS